MDNIIAMVTSILTNLVPWVAALWLLEKALEAIAVLTPWKWDDNVGVILAKILKFLENIIVKMVKK